MSYSIVQSPGPWNRLVAFRQRFGAKRTLYKFLGVVLHKLRTSVYTIVWLDVDSLAEMAPPDPKFTFRFLSADEVAVFAKDPTYYIQPALVDRVRSGREHFFAALAGDRLAAFGCYVLHAHSPEQAAGVAMSYPADVAFMSYGLTHPDFRGARLHGVAMGLALNELARRGVTNLLSMVAWTNWASLNSCYRLGYRRLGNMLVVGGPKRAIGLYPKSAKLLGVRFGRKAKTPPQA